MSPPGRVSVAVVVLLAAVGTACSAPTPEQALCSATLAMANEVQAGDQPTSSSIDAFVGAAQDVQDQELRDPAARAAAELATSPEDALDPLGEVYDRCVQLGLIDDGTRPPLDGALSRGGAGA